MILGEEEKPSLEDLAHYGVKGMHWGSRKGGAGSVNILQARARHNDRMSRLDTEGARLSFAKTTAEKTRILKGIHDITNEKGADEDAFHAARATRGEKLAVGVLTGGVGVPIAVRAVKERRKNAIGSLHAYRNSQLSDYHHA